MAFHEPGGLLGSAPGCIVTSVVLRNIIWPICHINLKVLDSLEEIKLPLLNQAFWGVSLNSSSSFLVLFSLLALF